MSSDATQIQNTLTNDRFVPNDYSDVQWQYLYDQNNGSYSNNCIQFITTILKVQLIDYHNAFLYVPFSVKSSGTAYTAGDAIAFRESVLQMIQSITFSTDSGSTLVNENTAPYYINMIRLRLERSFDYFEIYGDQLQASRTADHWLNTEALPTGLADFVPPTTTVAADWADNTPKGIDAAGYWNNPFQYLRTTTAASAPTVSQTNQGVVFANNPYYNESYGQRIGLFKNMTTFSGGVYRGVALLPLALLHDIWRSMNFLNFNIGFNMQFYLTSPDGLVPDRLPVMMTGDSISTISLPRPIIEYGSKANSVGGNCRLYYRSCKLNLRDSALFQSHLASNNYNKSINFVTTDIFNDRNNAGTPVTLGSTPSANQQITSSSVYPLRVWVMAYPTGTQDGSVSAHRWPMTNCPYYVEDANIEINTIPYKKLNMKFPVDHWNELSAQFPSETSTTFKRDEWRRFCKIMCFDIQRLGLERLTSPTEPVSLSLSGFLKKDSDVAYDNCKLLFLVERMNEVTFRFSQTDTTVVIGNISLNNTAA